MVARDSHNSRSEGVAVGIHTAVVSGAVVYALSSPRLIVGIFGAAESISHAEHRGRCNSAVQTHRGNFKATMTEGRIPRPPRAASRIPEYRGLHAVFLVNGRSCFSSCCCDRPVLAFHPIMVRAKASRKASAFDLAGTTRHEKSNTLKQLFSWWRRRYFMRVPRVLVAAAKDEVRALCWPAVNLGGALPQLLTYICD